MDTHKWLHDHFNIDNAKAPVRLEKFNRKNLAKLFCSFGYQYGAEVGVENGRYSKQICEQNPNVRLLSVDAWLGYPEYTRRVAPEKFASQQMTARRRLAPYNVEIINALSMDAVRDIKQESLDFVYIDGNHSFDYVMQDIIEWSKRVRRGGIVSGHDYYRFKNAGVVDAVNVYVYAHGIKEWFLTNENKAKSFFWVKR